MKYLIMFVSFIIMTGSALASSSTKHYTSMGDWHLFITPDVKLCSGILASSQGTNIGIGISQNGYRFSIVDGNFIPNQLYVVYSYTGSGKEYVLRGVAVSNKQIVFNVSADFISDLASEYIINLGQYGTANLSNSANVIRELTYCSNNL